MSMHMRPTIAVLGPGAAGGALAVRFLGAQYRTICVSHPASVHLMAYAGISLEAEHGPVLNARPEVAEELVQPVSVLLVTVKAPDLEQALERVAPEAVAEGVVLPLMNGLEHMEPIRARFEGRVAAGSLSRFEAYRVGRMQIIQTTPSAVITMASSDVSPTDLDRAARLLRVPGIEVEVEDDEKRVLWQKAARLAVLSAGTALARRTVGELRTDPEWRPRLEAALDEAVLIAAADGVELHKASQWARIAEMDHDLTTSAARDVEAGRPSEIDAIAGAVVRAGERLGVPCPVLTELVGEAAGL